MEFKKGSVIVTKDGEYSLIELKDMINPFTLEHTNLFLANVNGKERAISEKDVILVKNSQIENLEEP